VLSGVGWEWDDGRMPLIVGKPGELYKGDNRDRMTAINTAYRAQQSERADGVLMNTAVGNAP
jgi:hypothetical protein